MVKRVPTPKKAPIFDKNLFIWAFSIGILLGVIWAIYPGMTGLKQASILPANESWVLDDSKVSGLQAASSKSSAAVFQRDGVWIAIVGDGSGGYAGYRLNGASWQLDSSQVAGLTSAGAPTMPAVFQKDGTWVLINNARVGEWANHNGIWEGFRWTGVQWVSDTTQIAGLVDYVGSWASTHVYQNGGAFRLIAGKNYNNNDVNTADDNWEGYTWMGGQWSSDNSQSHGLNPIIHGSGIIAGGVNAIDRQGYITTYSKSGQLTAIVGDTKGNWFGYVWDGAQWYSDDTQIRGIPVTEQERNTPAVFEKDGLLLLIEGTYDGVFRGYYLGSVATPPPTPTPTATTTVAPTPAGTPAPNPVKINSYYGHNGKVSI